MRRVLVLALGLLASCSSPSELSRRPLPDLTPAEQETIATQVEKARRARAWTEAWNQAVEGGLDRTLFEQIALGALEDGDGAAESMFAQLRRKYAKLSPAARARVAELVDKALTLDGDYVRAAEIEVVAAEDAPAYAAAWAVYERTPAAEAPDVLSVIRGAREKAAKAGRDD